MTFSANSKSIKKVDAYDGGANQAKNDDDPGSNNVGNGEVTPTGTGTAFIPKEGFNETDEEKIKTRPKGCGCEVVGARETRLLWLAPLAALALFAARRRRA
jgi:MYXO-CTERM domain-containing protein